MTVVQQSGETMSRGGGAGSGNLYDILDLILDRGLIIDVFARLSLAGIGVLKIDDHIVASVDTNLRFAEACNRIDLEAGRKAPPPLTDLVGGVTEGSSHGNGKDALTGAAEEVAEEVTGVLEGGGSDGRETELEETGERPAPLPARGRKE
ncbi:gas vesicle protein GvpJ [Streptomyces sp. Pv4-95]|uniref:gas vesicle protein GvpJ n=1 Tax=Streptomyces sp. Pv4-95 TaxID=3049543 RepID=UPI0038914CC8